MEKMTLEEVWKQITILKNKTTDSALLDISLVCVAVALMPISVILSGMAGFNIDCFDGITFFLALVSMSVPFIILTIICYVIYTLRPKKVRLHISVGSHITTKQLAKFFKLSNVKQENGTIVCKIKPKHKYYNDVVSFLQEESETE